MLDTRKNSLPARGCLCDVHLEGIFKQRLHGHLSGLQQPALS